MKEIVKKYVTIVTVVQYIDPPGFWQEGLQSGSAALESYVWLASQVETAVVVAME